MLFRSITHYVVNRDASGNILEIVIKESVSPLSLDADVRNMVIQDADYKKDEDCELYTHIYKLEDEKFYICQEVHGIKKTYC